MVEATAENLWSEDKVKANKEAVVNMYEQALVHQVGVEGSPEACKSID